LQKAREKKPSKKQLRIRRKSYPDTIVPHESPCGRVWGRPPAAHPTALPTIDGPAAGRHPPPTPRRRFAISDSGGCVFLLLHPEKFSPRDKSAPRWVLAEFVSLGTPLGLFGTPLLYSPMAADFLPIFPRGSQASGRLCHALLVGQRGVCIWCTTTCTCPARRTCKRKRFVDTGENWSLLLAGNFCPPPAI